MNDCIFASGFDTVCSTISRMLGWDSSLFIWYLLTILKRIQLLPQPSIPGFEGAPEKAAFVGVDK